MPDQEKSIVPPTSENTPPESTVNSVDPVNDADPKPVEHKPLDPKEEARRRSKADLERKRNRLRGSHGKF